MSVGAGLGVGAACAPLNAPSVAIAPNSPAIFFSIFVSSDSPDALPGARNVAWENRSSRRFVMMSDR
jgi:hypothetical protein